MFFVSKFLSYTATMDGRVLNRIDTLDPRDPQRNMPPGEAAVTVTFASPPPGTVYAFADRIRNSDIIRDETGGEYHPTATDPYFRRKRALFSFAASAERDVRFNLDGPLEVGCLLFFAESDIVRTSQELFLTYPFEVEQRPRVTSITRADGSRIERIVGTEPLLRLTTNVVPAGDYKDFSGELEAFLEAVSPQVPFLYVGEEHAWDMFLVRKSPDRKVRHVRGGYNKQFIPALTLEVQ